MLVHSASLRSQIQDKDKETRQLQSKNASLDQKCERLRDYIRRLTSKCEEWATCYEEQSKLLTRVHGQSRLSRQQDTNGAKQESKVRNEICSEGRMRKHCHVAHNKSYLHVRYSEPRSSSMVCGAKVAKSCTQSRGQRFGRVCHGDSPLWTEIVLKR